MKIVCPNCEKKMPEKAVFCPKCGQKTATAKVRLRDLLWKLWMTTFHLDNKFFRAIFHLAIPGFSQTLTCQ
jgi:predicted amidophosphoribosyltransferase